MEPLPPVIHPCRGVQAWESRPFAAPPSLGNHGIDSHEPAASLLRKSSACSSHDLMVVTHEERETYTWVMDGVLAKADPERQRP
jgi:hypothetical protein